MAALLIVMIFIACIVHGVIQGSLRMLTIIGTMIFSMFVAGALDNMVASYMNDNIHLDQYIARGVQNKLGLSDDDDLNYSETAVQNEYINKLDIPASWKKRLRNDNTKEAMDLAGFKKFTGFFSYEMGKITVQAVSYLLTFFMLETLILIFIFNLGIVRRISTMDQVGKFFGGVLGIVEAVLVLAFIMALLAFLRNYGWGAGLVRFMEGNWLSRFFYRHNMMSSMISGF